MKKKVQKLFAMLLAFSMTMSLLCASASATGEGAPYWQITREVDGVTQTITHAVLDSNGNLVNIGAGPGELDADNLAAGTMAAQKFGAFANEADAANGIVKLTFDVVGAPLATPVDVVIIADESGSLNMYGRGEQDARLGSETSPKTFRSSASYMPCLNEAHAYLAGDLQKELYQIALVRMNAVASKIDEDLKAALSAALAPDVEDQAAALAAILAVETTAVDDAEAALKTAEEARIAAEEAYAPYAEVKAAADAVVKAEAVKTALAEEAAKKDAAQTAVDEAKADVGNAETAVGNAETAVDNATDEDTLAAAEADLAAAKADLAAEKEVLAAAEKALAAAKAAEEALVAAKKALADAEEALADAIAAYKAGAEQGEDDADSDEIPDEIPDEKIIEAAQAAKAAVVDAEAAVEEAKVDVEEATAALEAKKADVDVLLGENELTKKLTPNEDGKTACDYDVYINPHVAGLEYTVFGQWGNAGNEAAVRAMIKAGKLVDGTSANVEIPKILTDDDVYLALLSDWDEVALKTKNDPKSYLTFTTNYPVTKVDAETGETVETGEVKAEKGKRMGWNPDTAHCHFDGSSYVLIPQPDNTDLIYSNSGSGSLYSYWSPAANNKYGCYDRMMIEKEGLVSLANNILTADSRNRVAYVGFNYRAYNCLSSLGFLGEDNWTGLKKVMGNTNGHDWTNYIDAINLAANIIATRGAAEDARPCYVIFVSDGMPNKNAFSSGYVDSCFNTVAEGYADTIYDALVAAPTNATTADAMADGFKEYLAVAAGEGTKFFTVGFSTNAEASALLASMATSKDDFFNCADADEFLDAMDVIQQNLPSYPSGVLTDVIGEDFDLLVDEDHPFVVDGVKYESADAIEGGVTIDGSNLSWNLENVDEDGVQISFYVQLNNDELTKFEDGKSRLYDTNEDTDEATGANLAYNELVKDDTVKGYHEAEDVTNIAMKTPQLKIWNGEVPKDENGGNDDGGNNGGGGVSSNPPPGIVIPENPVPLAPMPEPEVPLAPAPELEEIPEEEVPLAAVPMTGDASALWMVLSALSGAGFAGVTVLGRKKEDEI